MIIWKGPFVLLCKGWAFTSRHCLPLNLYCFCVYDYSGQVHTTKNIMKAYQITCMTVPGKLSNTAWKDFIQVINLGREMWKVMKLPVEFFMLKVWTRCMKWTLAVIQNIHIVCVKTLNNIFFHASIFFAVFLNTDHNWNNLSALYTGNPYLNVDFEAFKNQRGVEDMSAELETSDRVSVNVVENQEVTIDVKETSKLRREVVVVLKELQNKAYICSDDGALRSCLHVLKNVNDLLSANAEKPHRLPLKSTSHLRRLPSRKRKLKRLGKFQSRVGKKAKLMREASVLGIYYFIVSKKNQFDSYRIYL